MLYIYIYDTCSVIQFAMYTEWRALFNANERILIYKASSSCCLEAVDKRPVREECYSLRDHRLFMWGMKLSSRRKDRCDSFWDKTEISLISLCRVFLSIIQFALEVLGLSPELGRLSQSSMSCQLRMSFVWICARRHLLRDTWTLRDSFRRTWDASASSRLWWSTCCSCRAEVLKTWSLGHRVRNPFG